MISTPPIEAPTATPTDSPSVIEELPLLPLLDEVKGGWVPVDTVSAVEEIAKHEPGKF